MDPEYPQVGICGLSCRLCPNYNTTAESRCGGCKSPSRTAVGCPFITCAVKRKGISFCWECDEAETCDRWRGHREYGRERDTFVCYQRVEENIDFIRRNGVEAFDEEQQERAQVLERILGGFNEGRSRRYYCVAATVLSLSELETAIKRAESESAGLDLKSRSRTMHVVLDEIAETRGYTLKLRK